MARAIFFFLTTLLFSLLALTADAEDRDQDYLISSGTREILPEEGQKATLNSGESHLIVQFYDIPDGAQRRLLAEKGIDLTRYVGGNAYIATLSEKGTNNLMTLSGVRATLRLEPEMKLSPLFEIVDRLRLAAAYNDSISVRIRFHQDVSFERALEILVSAGLSTERNNYQYFQAIELEAPWSAVERLLDADEVEWIDPSLPPPRIDNAMAAERANVNYVYKAATFNKPSGKGINVGVWDGGQVSAHKDFGNRVKNVETDEDIS